MLTINFRRDPRKLEIKLKNFTVEFAQRKLMAFSIVIQKSKKASSRKHEFINSLHQKMYTKRSICLIFWVIYGLLFKVRVTSEREKQLQ